MGHQSTVLLVWMQLCVMTTIAARSAMLYAGACIERLVMTHGWFLYTKGSITRGLAQDFLRVGTFGAIFASSVPGSQGHSAAAYPSQATATFNATAAQLTMTKEQLRLLTIMPWSRSLAASGPSTASQASLAQNDILAASKICGMQV
jgi:hypothetical protein